MTSPKEEIDLFKSSSDVKIWLFDNYKIYHFGKKGSKNIIKITYLDNEKEIPLTVPFVPIDSFFVDILNQSKKIKIFTKHFKNEYETNFDDKLTQLVTELSLKFPPLLDSDDEEEEDNVIFTTFVDFGSGVAQQIYRNNTFEYAVFKPKDNKITYTEELNVLGEIYQPVPNKELLRKKAILMPTEIVNYNSFTELFKEVKDFLGYWWIPESDFILDMASMYPFWSQVALKFDVTPYLHLLARFGKGKTRFLMTAGGLCRTPCFLGSVASEPVLSRILNKYKGTLLIDEADFKDKSDLWSIIVKVLNMGYMKDMPVLKTIPEGTRGWDLGAFEIFGPKVLATRKPFADDALNSRCLIVKGKNIEALDAVDILNLTNDFYTQRQLLQNKITCWGLENYHIVKYQDDIQRMLIKATGVTEPRLIQIMAPYMSIIDDLEMRRNLLKFMTERQQGEINKRQRTLNYIILLNIIDHMNVQLNLDNIYDCITVGSLATRINENLQKREWWKDQDIKISSQGLGKKLKNDLGITTKRDKNSDKRVDINYETLERLGRYYGLEKEIANILRRWQVENLLQFEG